MTHATKITAALVLLALAGASFADTLGFTSFEEPDAAAKTESNPLDVNDEGLNFTPGGGDQELGFSTSFIDTRGTGETGPVDGTESGDFIGVTGFTGSVGSFTDGVQGFQWNDPDGAVVLTLDAIDASAFTDLELTFDLFVDDTGYESTDKFDIEVNDTNVLSLGETDFEGSLADVWTSYALDLSAFDGSVITIEFIGDTNAGSENFYVDNVEVTGVPEPASIALLGLGGLALLRRRSA